MKKTLCAILSLLLLLSLLSACGSKTEAPADALQAVESRGKLIVAMEGDWAPWSFHGDDDAVTGFDAEVARAIAEKLGVECEIVEASWDALFAGLDAGRYDMVINGVEVTEERSVKYAFSEPYAYIRTGLIVRADNGDITSLEDLSGRTTANSIASTYMELAESYGATVSGVDTLDETLELVLQGRVDATLNAVVSYTDYMAQHPDAPLKIVATTEDASLVSVTMRKGDDTAALSDAVSEAVLALREDGTLGELSLRFFGEDITK